MNRNCLDYKPMKSAEDFRDEDEDLKKKNGVKKINEIEEQLGEIEKARQINYKDSISLIGKLSLKEQPKRLKN